MPDVDTPDPEIPATPEEIEAWPSGRVPDELPRTTENPDSAIPEQDPGDSAVPRELPASGENTAR